MIAPHSGKRVKSVSAKHVPDMPRIPTLMHVFPTFGFGGSQVRFAAIANHFGRTFRHLVLAMDGSYECMGRIEKGVEVERVVVPIRKRSTLRNAFVFRRFLHLRRPDVLVTYNWGAIEWALANWPQFVRHVHIEDGFGSEEAEVQFFRRVLSRRIALVRSTVVLPSQSLYRLARNTWKLPPDRTRHIANGIDCARFALTPETIAVPTGRGPVIGMVAALRPEKNIGRLLRVVRRVAAMTPCRLLIAGDGTERGKLEDLAGQLLPPGSYAFIGHFDEIERFYASIDILALTSDTEQMPTVVMEAMASGLPVVSTDVGDVAGMVATENQPFVVPRDDEAYFGALYRLVCDGPLRDRIGAMNREAAVQKFAVARMFSDYGSVFGLRDVPVLVKAGADVAAGGNGQVQGVE